MQLFGSSVIFSIVNFNLVNFSKKIFFKRFKKFARFNEKDAKKCVSSAKRFIKEYAIKQKIFDIDLNTAETPTPVPIKKGIAMFDFNVQEAACDLSKNLSNTGKLSREFNDYQSIVIDSDINVLAWWFKHQKMFPILSQIARRLICAQATSTPSERLFSATGYTVWDRRNALSPIKIDKMMVIHHHERNIKNMNEKYIEKQFKQ